MRQEVFLFARATTLLLTDYPHSQLERPAGVGQTGPMKKYVNGYVKHISANDANVADG